VPSPYELTRQDLAELLEGEPAYRARQVWEGLHSRVQRPEEMTELPASLRTTLEAALPPALTEVERRTADDGETTKWLWSLADGARVETVLMRYRDRVTVCVSTQAGCAMTCQFCATGQAGFQRHLSQGEIVEQVAWAMRAATPRRLSNVVFMGMGEPLANYDRVWGAVVRLQGDMGLSARHLTLSTVGIVPGIRRLSKETLPVNLAVSLHAANDALRDELVPINRRYPLGALADACADYVAATGRRLSVEWALIDGVNDRGSDAAELAGIARPLGAHVNLIPLNPTPGYPVVGSPPARVRGFRDELTALGVNATVRITRGVDIDAACGQLAAGAMQTADTGQAIRLVRRTRARENVRMTKANWPDPPQ
jgi:23S rRNA (adenine2503-C2)-methyltransferase